MLNLSPCEGCPEPTSDVHPYTIRIADDPRRRIAHYCYDCADLAALGWADAVLVGGFQGAVTTVERVATEVHGYPAHRYIARSGQSVVEVLLAPSAPLLRVVRLLRNLGLASPTTLSPEVWPEPSWRVH